MHLEISMRGPRKWESGKRQVCKSEQLEMSPKSTGQLPYEKGVVMEGRVGVLGQE